MGFGVVVRDEWGRILAIQSKTEQGQLEPTLAEARASLIAIKLCKNMGIDHIIFKGDAKVVINAILSEEIDGSCLSVIVSDIQSELQTLHHWRLSFVGREGNEVAHCLSKAATMTLTDRRWFSEILECVINVLRLEHM